MTKVLIIDDNSQHRLIYKVMLQKSPGRIYQIIEADNVKDGMNLTITEEPDCILLDYRMHGKDGYQGLHQMKEDPLLRCPPVIFLSSALEESMRRNVMALGAFACFDKAHVETNELCETVNRAVEEGRKCHGKKN